MTGEQLTTNKRAPRQKIRLTVLFLIMITFPITLNYFPVYL